MNNTKKISLVVFGFSDTLLLAILDKSKTVKVKKFNILQDDNEDYFFREISSFISYNSNFKVIYYSRGPGGFTIIRKIISYVKALHFRNFSKTKFIGLNHLFIIACYISYKCKLREQECILSILNHSNDNFVQLFKRRTTSFFYLDSLSKVNNIDLDQIESYLETFNLSLNSVHSVYLGPITARMSIFKNILLVDEEIIIEIISQISASIETNNFSVINYKKLFEENFNPLYGKLPSTK